MRLLLQLFSECIARIILGWLIIITAFTIYPVSRVFARSKAIRNIRTALITGASDGLGLAVALEYATLGKALIIVDSKDLTNAERQLSSLGVKVVALKVDFLDGKSLTKAIRSIVSEHDIDLAVFTHSIDRFSKKSVSRVFEYNAMSVKKMLRPIADSMKKRQKGHIVLTGSVVGEGMPVGGSFQYAASKSLISEMANTFQQELDKYNVNVTLLSPSGLHTRLADELHLTGLTSMTDAAKRLHQAVQLNLRNVTFPLHHLLIMATLSSLNSPLRARIAQYLIK